MALKSLLTRRAIFVRLTWELPCKWGLAIEGKEQRQHKS